MSEIKEESKERYYPNFIQQRHGNQIHFLTEVIGGKLIRRTVDLVGGVNIHTETEIFLQDAGAEAELVILAQRIKYENGYDGKAYELGDLPEGIDILDVLGEARRGVWAMDGRLTQQEAEVAVYMAVERKRARDK